VRYSDFTDEVRRECFEAPFAAIESMVRDASIELCKSARLWNEHRTVSVGAGEFEVRLKPSQEGRVDQVLRCAYRADGSERELRKIMDRGNINPQSGTPLYFSESLRGSSPVLHLTPAPDKACELDLYVVLVPQRASRMIPDFISEEWRDAIVHGALGRLLMQSGKPWTNPEKALLHKREFALAVRDARQQAASDNWTPQSIPLRRWV